MKSKTNNNPLVIKFEPEPQPGPITTYIRKKKFVPMFICFRVEAIHEFIDNPKYKIEFSDYEGTILKRKKYIRNKYLLSYPLRFSYAYKKNKNDKRALIFLTNEIMMLDEADQYKFYKFILKSKQYCKNYYFIKSALWGDFINECSIYRAILLEINTINKICDENKKNRIFGKEYLDSQEDLDEFRVMFLPTIRYYNHFVLITNKIINDSMEKFYKKMGKKYKQQIDVINKPLKRINGTIDDEKENPKNLALRLFLENELSVSKPQAINIAFPLLVLLQNRNKAAHEVIADKWNDKLWLEQDRLISSLYGSLRELREILIQHFNSKVVVPEEIIKRDNIYNP